MTNYIRDIESREINYRAVHYIENTIISVLKDFFGTYPGCLDYKWEGTPEGEELEKLSKISIRPVFPTSQTGIPHPTVVVRVNATPTGPGLGNVMEIGNTPSPYGAGEENWGMTDVRGFIYQGEVTLSVVSTNRIDTKIIASILLGHMTHVLYYKFLRENIAVPRLVSGHEYSEDKFLAGQNIMQDDIKFPFFAEIMERIPVYYEHYLIVVDLDDDGNLESYKIEDHEIPANRRESIKRYDSSITEEDEESPWVDVNDETAEKVLAEFLKQKAEGTLTLMSAAYLHHESYYDSDFPDYEGVE